MYSTPNGLAVACHDQPAIKKEPLARTPEVPKPDLILPSPDAITGDLRDLQAQRQPELRISHRKRLKSIAIDDPTDWLRWLFKGDLPPIAQHYIQCLAEGDLAAQAAVAQVRVEMGL